jgi:hypothetical protein
MGVAACTVSTLKQTLRCCTAVLHHRRNQLARKLGFIDYYDYKVTAAEGFGKKALFEILDGLELRTRPQVRATSRTHIYVCMLRLEVLC